MDKNHHEGFVTLPGLRYDDIDHLGQPSTWRLLDIIGRAEHAAFYNPDSFLHYNKLHRQGIGTFSQQLTMEFGRHFYEVTTPKSPLQIQMNIIGISDTSFTTCMSVTAGGRRKPSIQVKSLNILRHRESGLIEQVPDWWRKAFACFLPTVPEKPHVADPPEDMANSFVHHITVPFGDTDTSGHTRHPYYIKYLFDNMSLALNRCLYSKLTARLHMYCVRKISVLAYGSSMFGDALTVETFENPKEEELRLHCFVYKAGQLQWYGCVEFFTPIPELDGPL